MAETKGQSDADELGLSPGMTVLGKYRVERLIGRGGMGAVWLARHLRLDEDVALKLLLPAALAKPDIVGRFEREARAVVKLKSPHVARVLDVEAMPSGVPFIVMEYLDGQTLAGLVRGGAALPVDLAAEYILQACAAVAEAHALGIVHRDLKPGNLFLTSGADGSPVVKVLDFGVSKIGSLDANSGADVDTKPDAIVGSPPYMSPEQLRSSKNVDARTDIWSLGVCLFELATGRMPFSADNLHEHYTKLMLDPPPRPSQVRADLPPELDAIVARCLQREPSDRYATVGELARDLAKLAPDGHRSAERVERTLSVARAVRPSRPSLPAPPVALPPSGVLSGSSTSDRTELSVRHRIRRDRRLALVVGLVALSAALALIVSRLSSKSSTTPPPALPSAPVATAPSPLPPPVEPAVTSASAAAPISAPAIATSAMPAAVVRRPPRLSTSTSTSSSATLPAADLEHRK